MNTITEHDFINEIQSNPNQNSILIFADFLEENGEGNKSDFLRNAIQFPNNPDKFIDFKIYKNNHWQTIKDCNLTENRFKLFAIENAELVLPIFERRFPNDNRPRKALEVAKSSENIDELKNAANAAYAAAYSAARSAARSAAAYYAADAAYSAAYSAYSASYYSAYSARSAAYSAADAVNAVDFANREPFKIWQFIRIMEYKLFDSNELVSLLHKPEIK